MRVSCSLAQGCRLLEHGPIHLPEDGLALREAPEVGVGGEDCVCDETGKPILKPDCDEDIHACEHDPSSCAFATKACELKHSHEGGGLFGAAMRAVAAENSGEQLANR